MKNILKKKFKFKNKGFTLAEILVTLSIIGIIAAILFPSILANYTERTLNAKRQALVARMSQAMAELADKFAEYEDTENPAENSSLKFINEGLSKVYKISAVCDYATLSSCDIPEVVTRVNGTKFELIKTAENLESYAYVSRPIGSTWSWAYNIVPAGLITKNGESILLFFNPGCTAKAIGQNSGYYGGYVTATCVNMIFDLNGGKQKPNRVNEDIGFMTVLYSNMPNVSAPKILAPTDLVTIAGTGTSNPTYNYNYQTYGQAQAICAAFDENAKIPSLEEMASVGMNYALYTEDILLSGYNNYWTSTQFIMNDILYNKVVEIDTYSGASHDYYAPADSSCPFVCVYDN